MGTSKRGQMLDTCAAAAVLGLPAKTLTNWRHLRAGPPYYKVGAGVRYSTTELDAWLEARRVNG